MFSSQAFEEVFEVDARPIIICLGQMEEQILWISLGHKKLENIRVSQR